MKEVKPDPLLQRRALLAPDLDIGYVPETLHIPFLRLLQFQIAFLLCGIQRLFHKGLQLLLIHIQAGRITDHFFQRDFFPFTACYF